MLGPNVFVREALRFLGGIRKYPLAFIAQRKVNRCRNLFADGGMSLDLFAAGFDGSVRTQEPIGQGFVFTKQPQQQVLGLNIRRTDLAGFVPRKEDDPSCLFRITFEHIAPDLLQKRKAQTCGLALRNPLSPTTFPSRTPTQSHYRRPALVLPLISITKGTIPDYRKSPCY